jgi:hypothetical protein
MRFLKRRMLVGAKGDGWSKGRIKGGRTEKEVEGFLREWGGIMGIK